VRVDLGALLHFRGWCRASWVAILLEGLGDFLNWSLFKSVQRLIEVMELGDLGGRCLLVIQ
jgi:hypothetical protein